MSQYKVGQKVMRKRNHRGVKVNDDDYWTVTITKVVSDILYTVSGPSVNKEYKGDWNWVSDFFERIPTKLEKALK